jgi:hypothetical protein
MTPTSASLFKDVWCFGVTRSLFGRSFARKNARRVACLIDEAALLASLHLEAYSMKLAACSAN